MRRLFLGCPVPAHAAEVLHRWALDQWGDLPGVRVLAPEDLHATILFFGDVPEERVGKLEGLTRAAEWPTVVVQTGALRVMGRTALATELNAEGYGQGRLFAVIWGQPRSWYPPGWSFVSGLANELGPAERERVSRRYRRRKAFELHVTLARAKTPPPMPTQGPDVAFTLDHAALYESYLGPGGSRYTILARTRVGPVSNLDMPTAIHRQVQAAREGKHPGLIGRMPTGWLVFGAKQVVPGYCLLLPDPVPTHLNAMPPLEQQAFLADMARAGDALLVETGAVRINYEMLGNLEPALHAHLFPRYAHEPDELRTKPIWFYDWDAATEGDPVYLENLRRHLRERLMLS